jgi:hypothetical protein
VIYEKKRLEGAKLLMLVTLPEQKNLTVKLDIELLAEFAVAVRILRGRSVSAHLHHYIVSQINDARKMVPPDEFRRMVEEQKELTKERSESRSRAVTLRPKGQDPYTIALGADAFITSPAAERVAAEKEIKKDVFRGLEGTIPGDGQFKDGTSVAPQAKRPITAEKPRDTQQTQKDKRRA